MRSEPCGEGGNEERAAQAPRFAGAGHGIDPPAEDRRDVRSPDAWRKAKGRRPDDAPPAPVSPGGAEDAPRQRDYRKAGGSGVTGVKRRGRGAAKRPCRPPRPNGPQRRPVREVVELLACITWMQPGRPAGLRRRRPALLLRGTLRLRQRERGRDRRTPATARAEVAPAVVTGERVAAVCAEAVTGFGHGTSKLSPWRPSTNCPVNSLCVRQ